MGEPCQKRLLAPAWMVKSFHRDEFPLHGVVRLVAQGAWELAPTPADMLTSADMSAALFVTERWNKYQSSPCCELVIFDFSAVSLIFVR